MLVGDEEQQPQTAELGSGGVIVKTVQSYAALWASAAQAAQQSTRRGQREKEEEQGQRQRQRERQHDRQRARSSSSVGCQSRRGKKAEEQVYKYVNMDFTLALAGDPLKAPLYNARRTKSVMETSGLTGSSEYIGLVCKIELVEKCVNAWENLLSMSAPTRKALLEEINGFLDKVPITFQEKIFIAAARNHVMTTRTQVEAWQRMVLPSQPADGRHKTKPNQGELL